MLDVPTIMRLAAPKRGLRVAILSPRRVSSVRGMFGFLSAIALGLILLGRSVFPAAVFAQVDSPDLASQSLEDLMNIQVTSVSKQGQKLSQAASAVFVITAEDIRRSNATNIPDLLRMVPGMDIAQINANSWAISARGLNGRFADELLVLLDGRSIYTPTTDGVFWDVLDVPLVDIERIEVIRGPGASIWGTNAVNGVINIITKRASETQGGLIDAVGGTIDQGFGTAQYGGDIGNKTSFRAFAKYLNADHFPNPNGGDGGDGRAVSRVGFRTDTNFSSADTLTFEGDLYRGREGEPGMGIVSVVAPPLQNVKSEVNLGGGYLEGIWNHTSSSHSGFSLQASYSAYERNDALGETRGTLGVAFQHHFAWGDRQNIVWGAEYSYSQSRTVGSLVIALDPPNLNSQLFSSFVQDEIALSPSRAFLTVGVKLEHDYYTGLDVMPNIRFAWTPTPRQALWLAISEADRTPAETDTATRAYLGGFTGSNGPVALELIGNPKYGNEDTLTYEAGYRMSLAEQFSLDFTAYYNSYNGQETTEPAAPFFVQTPSPPHTVLPLTYANLMDGESHGAEISANWKVNTRWNISPGYAFEQIHMRLDPGSQDTTSVSAAQGSSPVHSAQLRSHFVVTRNFSWDTSAYFVDRLTDPVVPSYTRLDTGLTWQLNKKSALSLVGQNLTRDHHEEFVDSTGSAATTSIKRSIYAQCIWRF